MNPAIIIMSKVPQAGLCKTRLIPVLSAQECADFHQACLHDLLAKIVNLDWPIYLYYTGHPEYEDYRDNRWWEIEEDLYNRLTICPQRGKDLGERMYHAAREVLSKEAAVLLLGTDVPDMDPITLEAARQELVNHDVVIGPAEDGGYYLIGFKQAYSFLFNDIVWGSQQVLKNTLQRIAQHGLKLALLKPAHDIDTWKDLLHYHVRGKTQADIQKLYSYQLTTKFVDQYSHLEGRTEEC